MIEARRAVWASVSRGGMVPSGGGARGVCVNTTLILLCDFINKNGYFVCAW